MMRGAIALATVAAQAEDVWFSISNVYRPGTSDGFSTTGYFIYSDTMSQSAAVDAFYSKGASSDTHTIASSAKFTTRYLNGGSINNSPDEGTGAAMYVLCFDQDNNYMYVSPVANSQWDDDEEAYIYNNIDAAASSSAAAMSASGGYQGAGWYSVATSPVPEPTSGLLMLLGVAGLALKRKRA